MMKELSLTDLDLGKCSAKSSRPCLNRTTRQLGSRPLLAILQGQADYILHMPMSIRRPPAQKAAACFIFTAAITSNLAILTHCMPSDDRLLGLKHVNIF
jgi:hypothetical protein